MAKNNKNWYTCEVYKSVGENAKCLDNYTLFYPIPKSMQDGLKGFWLGFSFNEDGDVTMYEHGELKPTARRSYLGKKVQRETLPTNVKLWVEMEEKEHNKQIAFIENRTL